MRISEILRNFRLPAKAFHVSVIFFLIFILSLPLIPLSPKVHRKISKFRNPLPNPANAPPCTSACLNRKESTQGITWQKKASTQALHM